jgi:cytochrome c biogenesis protein CcdA
MIGPFLLFGFLLGVKHALEADHVAAVGVMLIVLGIDVLRRLRRRHVHVHAHRHGDGTLHLHAHAHVVQENHAEGHPAHEHHHMPASRAVVVGGIHGLAGSAALVLLALQGSSSVAGAVACLVAFGVGSVLGMMLFSLAISLPLRLTSNRYGSLTRRIEGAVGAATVALGCWIVGVALTGG